MVRKTSYACCGAAGFCSKGSSQLPVPDAPTSFENNSAAVSSQESAAKEKAGNAVPAWEAKFGDYVEQQVARVTDDGCIMDVCYPPYWDFEAEKKADKARAPVSKPAKTYPFVLDPFQRNAVDCLEKER